MQADIDRVLSFWFSDEHDQKQLIAKQSGLWWGKDKKSDEAIKIGFNELYKSSINDELVEWYQSARGQLALIILLDQFSRVIYRDQAEAFSLDNKALAITLEGVAKGIDKSLRPIERVFYYMPMEHSEKLEIQNHCVDLFQQLLLEVPNELKKEFQGFLEFARQHQAIIERFNRFPHRNKVLNRFSNADELAFLAEPGSSF